MRGFQEGMGHQGVVCECCGTMVVNTYNRPIPGGEVSMFKVCRPCRNRIDLAIKLNNEREMAAIRKMMTGDDSELESSASVRLIVFKKDRRGREIAREIIDPATNRSKPISVIVGRELIEAGDAEEWTELPPDGRTEGL